MENRKEQMMAAINNMVGTLNSVQQYLYNYNGSVVSYEDMGKVREVMMTLVDNVNKTMGLPTTSHSLTSYPLASYPAYPHVAYPPSMMPPGMYPYPNNGMQQQITPKPTKAKGPVHPFPNPKVDEVGSFKNGDEVKNFKVSNVNAKDRMVMVTFDDGSTLDIYWKRGYWAKKDECQTKKNMVGVYNIGN